MRIREFVAKKEDNSYGFTDYGQFMAYFYTIQKLLSHYLQKGMSLQPDAIKKKLVNLQPFIEKNFQTLDDYLDKLNLIADFIGESNQARLGQFIGQHFVSTLEKTQDQLMQRELPKAKDKYDNPYRTPSYDILDYVKELFEKAQPLTWPLPAKKPAGETSEENKEDAPPPIPEETRMPGAVVIEQLADRFENSEPLTWPLPVKKPASETSEENKEDAPPPIPEETRMPGEVLLEKFQNAFAAARPLGAAGGSEEGTGAASTSSLPVQISLKEFAQIVNAVAKFTAAKDNNGYRTWTARLTPKQKCALNINNLISKEKKGVEVPWLDEKMKMTGNFSLSPDEIDRVMIDVKAYRTLLPQIQNVIKQGRGHGGDPAAVTRLYPQLVSLFENKDTIDSKKTQMKMLLLQVTDPAAKKFLQEKLTQLLDSLKNLYQLA